MRYMDAIAPSHHPAPGHREGWICLRSDALSKLAAMELLADESLNLAEPTRHALSKLTAEGHHAPLRLWVQLDGVHWLAQSLQEQARKEAALHILVLRRANFGLLQRLFRINRPRWLALREQLGAGAPDLARPRQLSDDLVDDIYEAWHRLLREYDNDIDRWVVLAQQFRQLPLASMFQLIHDEGRDSSVAGGAT